MWSKKAILKLSGITLGTENLRFPEYASRGGAKLQPSDRAALRITPSHVPRTDLFRTYVQLNGYTLTGIKQIVVKGKPRESPLRIDEFPPLSAFIQLSTTGINAPQTGTQNWSAEFPQQLSLFFAGVRGNARCARF